MLTIDQKKELVENLSEQVKNSSGIYLADFKGVNVEKVTEFRTLMREKGVTVKVFKNKLLKRVFDKLEIRGLDDYLVGPTTIILADNEDPTTPAKVIVDFHKKNEDVISIKSVQMDGQSYEGKEVKNLAKMPGKAELQAQVVSLALGTGMNLIGLIKGPGSMVAGQINSLIERLEKE